jgi:ubiquinone/menaquinone biosynthesis C-methylase UbiE
MRLAGRLAPQDGTMRWLKKSAAGEPLAVAMSGVKLGDRVLVAGCSDPSLIAALAIKAGLTGRACAVDAARDRVEQAARAVERDGALVETSVGSIASLPFEKASFDVVVLRDVLADAVGQNGEAPAREVQRVLRPGGRCVVIDTTSKSALGGLLGSRGTVQSYSAGTSPVRLLESGGFVAVRTLAERSGLRFVEGVKRNA